MSTPTPRLQAPIVPAVALAAWRVLSDALAAAGPVPCQTSDPEAWWPDRYDSPRDALALCRRCPVRQECLAYALAADERRGVWGGTVPGER